MNGFGAAENLLPNLLPKPVKCQIRSGIFKLEKSAMLLARPGAEAEAQKLAEALRLPTGFVLPVTTNAADAAAITLELDASLKPVVGEEGYRLSVTPNQALIRAPSEAGLFYAAVTLRQLFPPEMFSPSESSVPNGGWAIPCVIIDDFPRFSWRGLLLDPARHFLPAESLKKFVDLMAMHKLNKLQLHLTDDQGWRIEIRKYPRLTEIGSVRKESPKHRDPAHGDGIPYGPFFYTQAEIRELVAYAQARHVTLVPEIEMPGHFRSALASYPDLSCTGGPFEVRTRWGVESDILCAGNDRAVAFSKDILDEVCELFPSEFIHIGGDECPRTRWKACAKCQARIKAEGLKNEAQLQTWFNHRIEEFLVSKGRRLIGWDEILEGGLTPGATVMSWRGISGGIAAAKAGHDVVMSPTSHCYFDNGQAEGPGEPECIGGVIPLPMVYSYEPVPEALKLAERAHVLGAQGNLWGEYIWTPRDVEYFTYPRAAAFAEVVWSSPQQKNYDELLPRLRADLERLDQLGVKYRPLDAAPPKR